MLTSFSFSPKQQAMSERNSVAMSTRYNVQPALYNPRFTPDVPEVDWRAALNNGKVLAGSKVEV
jgi:hypothetical protein